MTGEAPKQRDRLALLAGLLAGAGIAVDYAPVLQALVLAGYVAWCGGARRLGAFAVGLAPMCLLTAYYHWAAFGGPLATSYSCRIPQESAVAALTPPEWSRLYGLTLCPYKGLFIYAPWAALAAWGWIRGLRTQYVREVAVCGAACLTAVGLNMCLTTWPGYGWGPRFSTMGVPFLAILLAFIPRYLVRLSWPLLIWAAAFNCLPVLAGGALRAHVGDPRHQPPGSDLANRGG